MHGPLIIVFLAGFVLSGCPDDEPVAFSDVVSLKLGGIKEGDIKDDEASEEKNVNSESGNPYAEFLKDARAALNGAEPSAIGVTSVQVQMHLDTTGVSGIEEVFASFEVFLGNSATTIPIGSVDAPTGTSISVPVTPTTTTLAALQDAMKGGDFKVGVRGPTHADTSAKFDLRLTVDISFEALP